MSTNKIAILKASVCGPDTDGDVAHIRYTIWHARTMGQDRYTVILRYTDLSLDAVVTDMSVKFGIRDVAVVPNIRPDGEDRVVHAQFKLDAKQEIKLISLGQHLGYACYLLHNETTKQTPYHFRVSHVPHFGRANVIYDHDTARSSLERRNIVDVRHDSAGPTDDVEVMALFDYMHAKIVPIMQPYIDYYGKDHPIVQQPDIVKSNDVRQLERAQKYLRTTHPDSGTHAILDALLSNMRGQDEHSTKFQSIDTYPSKADWMRAHRTLTLNLGRQSGMTLMAQMLAHSKTLVLAYELEPRHFQFSNNSPGSTPIDARVYMGRDHAKCTYNLVDFMSHLVQDKYTSVILFNTNSLLRIPSAPILVDSIYDHLQGDLPRLLVLY